MSALERKKPAADLRRSYIINIQVGIIGTLLIFITIFKVNLDFTGDFEIIERDQDVIEMEEIIQTEQETTPPPPPRPPQPEPVPDDEIIEDQFFDLDTDLDLDAPMEMPPPPPPPDDEEEEPEIFQVVEDMPEPIGGLQAIYNNIVYPDAARRAGIEGRVIVQFVVDENGNVTNPQIIRGIGGGCDEAAIAAIQSVEWTVGRQRGRAVRVQFQLPIMFRLAANN
ncbi:energy transducer TonB [Balneolales bacterium ANBcel1]|nr:energy transducer TonB [Balneolales bacterium ANBcel1]